MTDFESRLSAILDDVATAVHPHGDPDAAFVRTVASAAPTGWHRLRPGLAAVAAAGVVLIGGSAFAMERLTSDTPKRLISPAIAVSETTNEPTTTVVAATSTSSVDVAVEVVTLVAVEPVITAAPVSEPTVPPTEPTVAPVVIEFTASLGTNGLAKNPMQQGFYGTGEPGSAIRVASAYGVSETTAGAEGKWATTLKMFEVPAGTKVTVRITSSTSDRVREFSLLRPTPAPPATIEFIAKLGADGLANTPMTQGFYGTAQAGSAIRVGSEWGVAETVTGPNGNWDATLVLPEVPPGTKVWVRVTSSTADKVYEFTLKRPGEPTPTFVAFTANAALTITDHTPPVNEYWGTSTAGAVISITLDYGSTQVEPGADGKWSVRLEFPDAPVGVTFNVHLTSSKGEATYDFPLTRVGPA